MSGYAKVVRGRTGDDLISIETGGDDVEMRAAVFRLIAEGLVALN